LRGVSRPYNETHKIIDEVLYKLCSDCNEWLPLEDNFYKNKSSSDGYYPYCKECTKKRSRKWAKDNPERYLELCTKDNKRKDRRLIFRNSNKRKRERGYYKDYYANNKSKFSEYGKNRRNKKTHDITDEEWENCKNYFNYRCSYCGMAIEDHWIKFNGKLQLGDFHKEHVDHEGANNLSNCVPSCRTCNSSKHLISLDEWYNPDNDNFSEERLNKILNWLTTDYLKYINNGVK
jgi:hypothetical protein